MRRRRPYPSPIGATRSFMARRAAEGASGFMPGDRGGTTSRRRRTARRSGADYGGGGDRLSAAQRSAQEHQAHRTVYLKKAGEKQAEREAKQKKEATAAQHAHEARSQHEAGRQKILTTLASRRGGVKEPEIKAAMAAYGHGARPSSTGAGGAKTAAERLVARKAKLEATMAESRRRRALYDKSVLERIQRERDPKQGVAPATGSPITVQVSPGGATQIIPAQDTRMDAAKWGRVGLSGQGYDALSAMHGGIAGRYGGPVAAPAVPAVDPNRLAAIENLRQRGVQPEQMEQALAVLGFPPAPPTPSAWSQAQAARQAQAAEAARAVAPMPQGMTQAQYVQQQEELASHVYPGSQTPTLPIITAGQHAYAQDRMGRYGMARPDRPVGPNTLMDQTGQPIGEVRQLPGYGEGIAARYHQQPQATQQMIGTLNDEIAAAEARLRGGQAAPGMPGQPGQGPQGAPAMGFPGMGGIDPEQAYRINMATTGPIGALVGYVRVGGDPADLPQIVAGALNNPSLSPQDRQAALGVLQMGVQRAFQQIDMSGDATAQTRMKSVISVLAQQAAGGASPYARPTVQPGAQPQPGQPTVTPTPGQPTGRPTGAQPQPTTQPARPQATPAARPLTQRAVDEAAASLDPVLAEKWGNTMDMKEMADALVSAPAVERQIEQLQIRRLTPQQIGAELWNAVMHSQAFFALAKRVGGRAVPWPAGQTVGHPAETGMTPLSPVEGGGLDLLGTMREFAGIVNLKAIARAQQRLQAAAGNVVAQ